MKKLIVNADDLGLNSSVNKAIISLLEKGLINSATLMANMPGFEEAVEMVKGKKLDANIGLHLVLTNGEPVGAQPNSRPYFFNGKSKLREKFQRNPFAISKDDRQFVYQEFSAQIEKLRDNGLQISHLDSHHHVHEYFGITRILVDLCRKYQIPSIRILNNLEKSGSLPKQWYRSFVNAYLNRNGLQFSSRFGDRNDFLKIITGSSDQLDKYSFEIMVHPDMNDSGHIVDRVGANEFDFEFLKDIWRKGP